MKAIRILLYEGEEADVRRLFRNLSRTPQILGRIKRTEILRFFGDRIDEARKDERKGVQRSEQLNEALREAARQDREYAHEGDWLKITL